MSTFGTVMEWAGLLYGCAVLACLLGAGWLLAAAHRRRGRDPQARAFDAALAARAAEFREIDAHLDRVAEALSTRGGRS